MDQKETQKNQNIDDKKDKEIDRHINLIVIGMAGSGKTTFMGVIFSFL